MSGANANRPKRLKLRAILWMMLLGWTLAIIASMVWDVVEQNRETREHARIEARSIYEKDVLYRRWNAGHGGVYVPVRGDTQPNPYLDVPERDIVTSSGRLLTLMNPAYMTRQVHELGTESMGVLGHITSLNPIRPENGPDAWEAEALQAIAKGEPEVSSIERIGGAAYMRLMSPLPTEESCLKCHAVQGYKVGDIRGGISVSVPMQPLYAVARRRTATFLGLHVALWLLGAIGILLACRTIQRHFAARESTESALHESEERYRTLINNLPVGLYRNTAGPRGEFKMANPAVAQMFGFDSVEEFMQTSVADLYADPEMRKEFSEDLLRKGKVASRELPLKKRDGTPIWGAVTANVIRDESGNIHSFDGMIEDITERKRAEDERERERAKLSAMISSMEEGVVFADAEDRVVEVNDYFARFVGRERDEILGRKIWEFHENAIEQNVRSLLEGFRSGPVSAPVIRQRTLRGADVIMRFQPIYRDGEYEGVLLNIVDVTELVRAREEAERVSRELAEHAKELEEAQHAAESERDRANKMLAEVSEAKRHLEVLFSDSTEREKRMIQLKAEVNELLRELGRSKKYKAPERVSELFSNSRNNDKEDSNGKE